MLLKVYKYAGLSEKHSIKFLPEYKGYSYYSC